MTDLREVAQQALEALEEYQSKGAPFLACDGAADALRAALAQQEEPCPNCASLETQNTELDQKLAELEQAEPVQEPVAWYQKRGQEVLTSHPACWGREDEPWTPLYTAPPQRKPLTEEEIDRICASLGFAAISPVEITRAVEQAHGIGEQP